MNAIVLGLVIALSPALALAAEYTVGTITISQPWARATAPTARTGAGYLTIMNTGKTPDRLTRATCAVATMTGIHEMKMEGNVMRMRELEHGLAIAPGATVSLAPDGFHIMLMGLKTPLKQGTTTACTLTFEKAGSIAVQFQVEALGATKPPNTH